MSIQAGTTATEKAEEGKSGDRRYKRPFDTGIVVGAHLLLAPIWLILWIAVPIAIKLDDRGPVFYSQKRIGRKGKVFTVRKFRSMVMDAEKKTGAVWAGKNDPRITRVGRFLRHTALDELPQVVNVLKGEMSLVGPRPERPELHEQINLKTPGFDERLKVRPGMAGLAQVYGEYDLAPDKKLAYDLQYIRSAGFLLDLKLLTLATLNSFLGRWGHAKGMRPAINPEDSQDLGTGKIVAFTPPTNGPTVQVSKAQTAERRDRAA